MNNMRNMMKDIGNGSEKAATYLISRYSAEVRCYAAKIAPRPGMAEDIAQNAFIECLKSISNFDAGSDFMPWMRGIIRNMARREWERIYREEKIRKDGLAVYIEKLAAEMESYPEQSLKNPQDRLRALRNCVKKLSDRGKELISLKYSLQITCREIAKKIGANTGAVKMALSRIRRKLKKCIEHAIKKGLTHE